ncbi:Hypothetical protein PHPALM_204 [Phytophthora palmivora]|uniref:Integrase catalytic domain-containing protein n=1 Tax=Phytophthora palmivora TaxID=4796 RepID=A0A2P4YVF1_9STRA|nr:Hypothetical protein PHPALM_204 [Phytophthora palmivora]
MFKYVIEHVSGEQNVWGYLLSRWDATSKTSDVPVAARVRSLAVLERMSPLQDADFQWPSHTEIALEQNKALTQLRADSGLLPPCHLDSEQGIYLDQDGKIWIPDGAVDLQQRLCIIVHAGAMGHRGIAATTQGLKQVFSWGSLAVDVQTFVRNCLHCMTGGVKTVPRPYEPALHATKPNELIHFDYLSMPASSDGLRGAHFKNELVALLKKELGGSHHFTTAYCRWANGSVEVVNRILLRCLRALLSELKLAMSDWTSVLPIVQSALNQTPAYRLGGVTPVTAFTVLPATTPLRVILHPSIGTVEDVTTVVEKQRQHIADARA